MEKDWKKIGVLSRVSTVLQNVNALAEACYNGRSTSRVLESIIHDLVDMACVNDPSLRDVEQRRFEAVIADTMSVVRVRMAEEHARKVANRRDPVHRLNLWREWLSGARKCDLSRGFSRSSTQVTTHLSKSARIVSKKLIKHSLIEEHADYNQLRTMYGALSSILAHNFQDETGAQHECGE